MAFSWAASTMGAGWETDGDFARRGSVFVDASQTPAQVWVSNRSIDANRIEFRNGVLVMHGVGRAGGVE